MLFKSLRLFAFFLFVGFEIFGQENFIRKEDPAKVTFYYNQSWELTTPEKSFFKREAVFDLQDMVFDGVYKDYDKENNLVAEGFYAHGEKRGIQTEYYSDLSIKSTIEFSDWDFIIWQMVDPNKVYEVTRGTGKFTINFFYYNDLKFKEGILSGEFQNGKRVGTWVYSDLRKIRTDVEYYKNGNLTKHLYYTKTDSIETTEKKEIFLSVSALLTEALAFDKEVYTRVNQYFESQVTYPSTFQRNVAYPGGLKRLLWLLSQETYVPEKNLALIKLKFNEHGQLLKSTMIRWVDENTDARVDEAIRQHESRFLPAMKNGKPIVTSIYLPVATGEEWLKTLHEMPTEWFLESSNFLE